ncbi:MAG: hypothetical protein ABGY42_12855, partial [bacterium]
MGRLWRKILFFLLGLAGLAGVALLVLDSSPVRSFIKAQLEQFLAEVLRAEVSIGSLQWPGIDRVVAT